MANRFTVEVNETGTQRTKDEIVRLLQDLKSQASDASRTLDNLKTSSISAREATASHAKTMDGLKSRLAETQFQLGQVNKELSFHKNEYKAAEKSIASYEVQIDKNSKTLAKLAESGQGQSKQAKALVQDNQRLGQAINSTTNTMEKHFNAVTSLTKQQTYLTNGQAQLVKGLLSEKQAHSDLVQAQNNVNTSKQKAQIASSNLEKQIKTLNGELRAHQKQESENEKQTKNMEAATIALANAVGYAAYNAFRRLIDIGKEFIENAVIYAARTDELRLAMLNMSKMSGVSRGQLLAQAESMQKMNITTQETYNTLVRMQQAQLDVAKATQLARVAQDLAVVAGVETGEEVDRLVHGITTLQIRVLRTAGVYVSLEGALKDAAVAQGRSTESFSEAEKQQVLLNKVLEVGARANGNYETSLDNAGKRMRSMVRIFNDLQNAIGGLLQGPFGNLVDSLSGLMKLVSAAPKVFLVLTLAFVAFGIQLVKNIGITRGWIGQLYEMIAALRTAASATLGFNAANATTGNGMAAGTTAATRFAGALGLIAATAGRMLLAFVAVNTALAIFAEISKKTGGTTTFKDLGDDIKFDRSDLKGLRDELDEVTKKIDELKQKGSADKFGRSVGFLGSYRTVYDQVPTLSIPQYFVKKYWELPENLTKRQQELKDDIEKVTSSLENQGDEFGLNAALQRQYTEAVGKAGRANLDFSGTSEIVHQRLERIKKQLEALAEPLDKDTGFTLNFAERLSVLKPEILDLDTILQKTALSQEDYNNAVADAEKQFPGFTEAVRRLRSEGEKLIVGVGEQEAESIRRLIDVQRRLASARREIRGLLGLPITSQEQARAAQAGVLETEEKRLQIMRQEIDAINAARINLGRDVGRPIPTDREQRVELQNVYETAIKVRDEVRAAQRANRDFIAEVVKAQQIASNARTNTVTAELTAAKMIADNQVKRIQDERQMTAEIIALSKDRQEQANDEAGTQRRAFKSFYKEQLEGLFNIEDQARRAQAVLDFNAGKNVPSLKIPEFANVATALENIAVPAATQAENIATITQSVQNIEKKVTSTTTDVTGLGGVSTATVANIGHGGKGVPLLSGDVANAAKKYGLDPNLLLNLAYRESGIKQYDEYGKIITSSAGALGVMQLMPGTAKRYGADPSNTAQNIDAGAHYLADLIKMFGGQVTLALAGYNAGEFVSKAAGGGTISQREARLKRLIQNNSDVQAYVKGILGYTGLEYGPETTPRLERGALGTAFKQSGSFRVTAPTPAEIVARTNAAAEARDAANAKIQQSYIGSPLANINFAAFRIQTSDQELDNYKQTAAELKLINTRISQDFYDSEAHKQQVTVAAELARRKAVLLTHDTLIAFIDEEKKGWRDSEEYKIQVTEDAENRIRQAYNDSRDTLEAVQADQRKRAEFHEKYLETVHNAGEAQRLRFTMDTERNYDSMLEESNSKFRESTEFKLAQWRNFEINRYEEAKKAEDDISELNYQIAHATDLDPLKIEQARLRAILEVKQADGEARASMEANAIKIADAQIYHADRANAKILEYFAQQKTTDDVVAEARISTMEKIFGAIDTGLSKLTSKLGFFGDIVKEIISGFAKIALSRVFLSLFGLSPIGTTAGGIFSQSAPQQQGSGGTIANIFGSLLGGFGNIFQRNVGGGNTVSTVGTPPFAGNLFGSLLNQTTNGGIYNSQQATQQILANVFGLGSIQSVPSAVAASRVGPTATWGDFAKAMQNVSPANFITQKAGFGGILGSISSALPLLGVGLGAQLGGSSVLGSILGSAGGGLLGLGGAALLGSSSAASALGAIGSLGGLLPFTIGLPFLVAPLLVGAIALNINKKRRENEKKRDAFTSDALSQLNNLLSQVRRDKISGDEALSQAAQIRTQYMSAAQALNDSKTRNIALKDVSRLDLVISQIKAAGKAQERRHELDQQLVPEFAGGVRIVPGPIGAGDIVPALLSPGEMVLNYQQQKVVGFHNLARANVPSYSANGRYGNGGYVPYSNSYGLKNNGEMNIYIVADKKFAEDLAVEGRDRIVEMSASDIRNRGKMYSAIRNI